MQSVERLRASLIERLAACSGDVVEGRVKVDVPQTISFTRHEALMILDLIGHVLDVNETLARHSLLLDAVRKKHAPKLIEF